MKRGHSTGKPTKAEASRIVAAKWETGCVPCLAWARAGNMPLGDVAECCEYDHKKSGNRRRGHRFGFASCLWHHRRVVPDGWTHATMRAHFGPSLMDGSRLFRETYGTDDELIALQDELLSEVK